MPSRKRANKNFVHNAISTHSMNLRSRSIVSRDGNIDQLGFDTKLSSMTSRTLKRPPNVIATSKPNTKIQKVVKKPQQQQIGESAQIEAQDRIEPQTMPIRITTFDDLIEDCLLIIFGKFGLQELMLLRAISPRCLSIIERMFGGMRSLKLFVGYYSVQEYFRDVKLLMLEDEHFRLKPNGHSKNDDLVLNYRKTTNFCSNAYDADVNPTTFLPNLFPNVKKLFISLSKDHIDLYIDKIFDFSFLLPEFSHLSTLFMLNPPSHQNSPLWDNIASKTALRSLYLISIRTVFHIPIDTYHNLQQLTIVVDDNSGMDFILPHLGPNCTQLSLYWRYWEFKQLQAGLDSNSEKKNNLKNTITHFSIGPQYFDLSRKDLLLSTCAQLKSLTFLQISLYSQIIKLKDIFAQLASLPLLTELRLLDLHKHLEIDESEASTFRPLSSITNLSLYIMLYQESNVKFNILQDIFSKVFPSLIKASIICKDETILNESRECFSNIHFPHLLQSSFYTDLDAMFEPSKYLGQHFRNYTPKKGQFLYNVFG